MPAIVKEAETQIQRVADFFSGQSGQANYERLRHFAEHYANRYQLLCSWISDGGRDFLQDTVSSCMTCREDGQCQRRIPPGVPMMAALTEILKSKIGHAFASRASQARGAMPGTAKQSEEEKKKPVFEPTASFWEAEGDRLTESEKEKAATRFDQFIASTKADPVVHGMLLLIRDEGLDKPASLIAVRLRITEPEVYVARKRLATMTARFIKQEGVTK